jgi:hypothetical protein
MSVRGRSGHTFAKQRPAASGAGYPLQVAWPQSERDTRFRELPEATGVPPFRLDLQSILPQTDYNAIANAKRLTFHVNGDMGGIMFGVPQELVAYGMEGDFDSKKKAPDNPAILYLVGDCVYFNGEPSKYYEQFYRPYEFYTAPIFAVPGNHDGENLSTGHSLDGFIQTFCQSEPKMQPEAGDSGRTAMVQPNVYWTLVTPMVNIVGLYSNVPEGGDIRAPQTDWLEKELRTLPKNVPLFVALHHPVYSADNYHSGSLQMKQVIEAAADAAGRHPDMILAGHVHDYQRLSKQRADGTIVPYLITGAGGYHNLHRIQRVIGQSMIPPVTFTDRDDDPVTLERYSDDHHGFLRLEVTDPIITGRYYEVPRPQDPYSKPRQLIDYFEFNWRTKQFQPNTLATPAKKTPAKKTTAKKTAAKKAAGTSAGKSTTKRR